MGSVVKLSQLEPILNQQGRKNFSMKKTTYIIRVGGAHRLRFTATEGQDNAILTPTTAVVKADDRIKLTAKGDKLGKKASRKALLQLLDFPNQVMEPRTGAQLVSLALLAQVAPLYAAQGLTPLPAVYVTGALRIPDAVSDVLRAMQGKERWSGDEWHLRRPWTLRTLIPVGAAAPENDTVKLVGGKATQIYGRRVQFWAPYSGCAVAFAPDLPASVRREILKASPLMVPITVSAGDRPISVKLAANDLVYRASDDIPTLRDASPVVQRFVRWLEKGDHARRWVDAIRANGGGRSCSVTQGERELWCAALSLVTLFLDWTVRKAGFLTEAESNALERQYVFWLGSDGPKDPSAGAVDLCQASAFYTFLRDYLRENAAHVTEKSGCADTVARIHVVNRMDPSLTLPREVTFRAYAAGRTAPEDVDLQRALMTAGIPFRTEGKDTSWRYAFYAKGKAPKGQPEKLPCLSMPLVELPLAVQSELVKLFGDRFGSLLSHLGEESGAEAENGGENQ